MVLGSITTGVSYLTGLDHLTLKSFPVKNIWKVNSFVFQPGRQYIKDVLVDGQSYLMIIREETELPGAQVGYLTRKFSFLSALCSNVCILFPFL